MKQGPVPAFLGCDETGTRPCVPNDDEYTDIKGCIANLAEELPELKFALDPMAWPDFETVDSNWMVYVTEDLYDEILKNEAARKKLKEYCESVQWGKEIKELIWKKF